MLFLMLITQFQMQSENTRVRNAEIATAVGVWWTMEFEREYSKKSKDRSISNLQELLLKGLALILFHQLLHPVLLGHISIATLIQKRLQCLYIQQRSTNNTQMRIRETSNVNRAHSERRKMSVSFKSHHNFMGKCALILSVNSKMKLYRGNTS